MKGKKGFEKGQDWNGNRKGRPRVPELELFRKAREEVEKKKKMSLYKHAVQRAFKSDVVLIAILKKTLPDKFDVDNDVLSSISDLIKNIDEQSKNKKIS